MSGALQKHRDIPAAVSQRGEFMVGGDKSKRGKVSSQKTDKIRLFGVDLRRIYPLPDDKEFEDLLQALDHIAANNAEN